MATISSDVATGRRMNGRDGLTAELFFVLAAFARLRRPAGRSDHFRAVGQLVEIVGRHHRARINTLHRRNIAVRGADRDGLHRDGPRIRARFASVA